MIDDEPGGLAEALRAEPGPVAVPGQDEQIRLCEAATTAQPVLGARVDAA